MWRDSSLFLSGCNFHEWNCVNNRITPKRLRTKKNTLSKDVHLHRTLKGLPAELLSVRIPFSYLWQKGEAFSFQTKKNAAPLSLVRKKNDSKQNNKVVINEIVVVFRMAHLLCLPQRSRAIEVHKTHSNTRWIDKWVVECARVACFGCVHNLVIWINESRGDAPVYQNHIIPTHKQPSHTLHTHASWQWHRPTTTTATTTRQRYTSQSRITIKPNKTIEIDSGSCSQINT